MSVGTARLAAKRLGFTHLGGAQHFLLLESLRDKEPVTCLLVLVPSRHGSNFHWELDLNAKAVTQSGTGDQGDLEKALVTCLVLYEAHLLRKESP